MPKKKRIIYMTGKSQQQQSRRSRHDRRDSRSDNAAAATDKAQPQTDHTQLAKLDLALCWWMFLFIRPNHIPEVALHTMVTNPHHHGTEEQYYRRKVPSRSPAITARCSSESLATGDTGIFGPTCPSITWPCLESQKRRVWWHWRESIYIIAKSEYWRQAPPTGVSLVVCLGEPEAATCTAAVFQNFEGQCMSVKKFWRKDYRQKVDRGKDARMEGGFCLPQDMLEAKIVFSDDTAAEGRRSMSGPASSEAAKKHLSEKNVQQRRR